MAAKEIPLIDGVVVAVARVKRVSPVQLHPLAEEVAMGLHLL
tara:strand:- start:156 stop:281 length:126 start_codon:yes stop_codon:yes gene_type:complete